MEVILLERIRNLGNLGDCVKVKAGFGRNYLIPQQKAVPATKVNIEKFEQRRAEYEQKAKDIYTQAEARAAKLNGVVLTIEALASDDGKLYGSVGTAEIAAELTKKVIEICKSEVLLPIGSIRATGEYEIDIALHSDIIKTIQLNVIAEESKAGSAE